jgi:hypothetical protein
MAEPKTWRKLLKLSAADIFLAAVTGSLFCRSRALHALLSDGDTGWHIRTGETILATGRIPARDIFSFSRPAAPWFAWEWLSDVIFAWVYRLRGLEAVAALAAAVIAAAAVLLFLWMLSRGCGLWASAAAALAAISAGTIHFLARPHIFSLLLLVAGLWLLDRDRRRSTRAVWVAVPLAALWANLHGGFLVWIAVLGLAAGAAAWESDWPRSKRYLLVTAASALATLANPYGWRLHRHILSYLSSSWILDHVQEFQSPRIRSENMVVFAVLLLAGTAAAALEMARGRRFEPLLVWCLGFAALRSARHVPLYALAAAPLVAAECAALWQRAAAERGPRSPLRIFWELGQHFGLSRGVGLWGPLAAAVLIAAGLGEARIADFPRASFPVAAVEKNRAILTPPGAMPRILTSDQWADYLLFRLYPRQRVFFDGRSDFYGPGLGDDYQVLECAKAGWPEILARYGFELALLPRDWPLGRLLATDANWERVYDDGQAALYRRRAPGVVGRTPGSARDAHVPPLPSAFTRLCRHGNPSGGKYTCIGTVASQS